jgi:hypothetical protein
LLEKDAKKFFPDIRKIVQYNLKNRPHICHSQFQKRTPIVGISMNSRTGGFRKWSVAHDPKITAARAVAGEAAFIPAPELDQTVTTPGVEPHRPWLVPGTGTL